MNGMHSPDGDSAFIRKEGRALILAMYGALRGVKLYPVEHSAVQKALGELSEISENIRSHEGELDFRLSGEFIFVNSTRLRLDMTNYASFGHLLTVCKAAGIGGIRINGKPASRDWTVLFSLLNANSKDAPEDRFIDLGLRLEQANVTVFELEPPAESEGERKAAEESKAACGRTYAQCVNVTKDVINSVRMGRTPSIKKIKRVVQGIVDQVLNDEISMIGLTAIRDYDDYTFTHSVNVCIFAIALGRRLGMTKPQLYELGLAALLHDIGKSRVPIDILKKTSDLNDDEWRWMLAHPWLGLLCMFQMKGQQDLPYRSMIVAYQHHMRCDLSGYPKHVRPTELSMTSRIVAVADGYDAATSRRSYQTEPYTPPAVLQEMRDNPKRGMDQIVVKAFINLLGIYPVGTLVVLDTFELAVVHSANPDPDALGRPVVKIVSDSLGNLIQPPVLVDLNVPGGNGEFERTIIKTADPERYGIRIDDYFV